MLLLLCPGSPVLFHFQLFMLLLCAVEHSLVKWAHLLLCPVWSVLTLFLLHMDHILVVLCCPAVSLHPVQQLPHCICQSKPGRTSKVSLSSRGQLMLTLNRTFFASGGTDLPGQLTALRMFSGSFRMLPLVYLTHHLHILHQLVLKCPHSFLTPHQQ